MTIFVKKNKQIPDRAHFITVSCFPPKETELVSICSPIYVKNPDVSAISDPISAILNGLSTSTPLFLNIKYPSRAPNGCAQPPNVPLMSKAFHLELSATYIGSVIVKPSTKLWTNIERKMVQPNFESACDVEYMIKPSGNLCIVIAKVV